MSNTTTPTEEDEQTPYIDSEDGLWIPPKLRSFSRQIVFRTPRATIQHQDSTGELDAYYGLIDETHFGPKEELTRPSNPDLAPNQITVKPEGKEETTYTLPDPTNDDD